MKHYFPIPFVSILALSSLFSLFKFFTGGFSLAWLGASIAVIPMFGFFMYLSAGGTARTGQHLPLQLCSAIIGVGLTLLDFQLLAFCVATLAGLLGTCIYSYWYSPLDRSKSRIHVGEVIPAFEVHNIDGQPVNSRTENGRKKIWMFVRGNWCPLCVAQVKEMADAYQAIEALGADVFLISSQSENESKKLASRFNANIQFLVDVDNQVAETLGIDHVDGVPAGLRSGYDANTAMPTVVITDTDNKVVFASQTDNYRVRPEPDVFIGILKTV